MKLLSRPSVPSEMGGGRGQSPPLKFWRNTNDNRSKNVQGTKKYVEGLLREKVLILYLQYFGKHYPHHPTSFRRPPCSTFPALRISYWASTMGPYILWNFSYYILVLVDTYLVLHILRGTSEVNSTLISWSLAFILSQKQFPRSNGHQLFSADTTM